MTNCYVEIVDARLVVGAADATYAAQFDFEFQRGHAWELDPMSDAVGQQKVRRTGNIRVRFAPVKDTMSFPEDAKRQQEYILNVVSARSLWKLLTTKQPNYWFALDVASSSSV